MFMLSEIFMVIYLGISSLIYGYTLTMFKEETTIAFLLFGKQSEIQRIMRAPSKPALPLAQHRLADNKMEIKMGTAAPIPRPVSWHQSLSGINALGKVREANPAHTVPQLTPRVFPEKGSFTKKLLSQLAFKVITKYKAVEFYVG